MNQARVLAVAALVTGLLLVVFVAGCPGGGEEQASSSRPSELTIRDPLTEGLRYIPQGAAIVAVAPTDTAGGPLREALDIAQGFPGASSILAQVDTLVSDRLGLSLATEVPALAGSPAVLARLGVRDDAPLLGAWVVLDEAALGGILRARVDAGDLTESTPYKSWTVFTRPSGVYAQRDRVLLTASDQATLRAAIDRRLRTGRGGGLTPGSFATRARSGIPAPQALVRIALDGAAARSLLARAGIRGVSKLPWVAGLRGAGLAVGADDDGLHVKLRVRTDEAVLTDADLPLKAGREVPEVLGDAPVAIGVRDPAQTIGLLMEAVALRDPERLKPYTEIRDLLRRVARVDLQADVIGTLRGDATLTLPDGGGVVLRAVTTDAERLRGALTKLGRLGRLGGLAGALGVGPDTNGLAVRSDGEDRYTIVRDENPIALVALRDDVLVVSSDPLTDADAVVDAGEPTDGRPAGERDGALRAVITPTALGDLLVEQLRLPAIARVALEPLGTATVSGRAELGSLLLAADVEIAR